VSPASAPPLSGGRPGTYFQKLFDPALFGQYAPPQPAPPGQFLRRLFDPALFGQNAPQQAPPGRFLASIGVNLPEPKTVLATRPVSPVESEPRPLAVRPVPAPDVILDDTLLESAPALPGQDIAGFGSTPARMPAEFERTRGDGVWRNAVAGVGEHVYGRIGQYADPAADVINGGIDGLNWVAGTDVDRLPVPSRWLAETAEAKIGVPDPQHTLAVTPGEQAARLGGKAAAFLADLRFLRGRGLPGYVLPGPGLPIPGDGPGQPAPTDPGQPERWDASYEDARALGQFGIDLFGELRDAVFPPALKSLDQAGGNLVGGITGPGGGMPQLMVQGGRSVGDLAGGRVTANNALRPVAAPTTGGGPTQPYGESERKRLPPPDVLPRLEDRYTHSGPAETDDQRPPKRGVTFFDIGVLPNVDRPDASLGRQGGLVFFMPVEDSYVVRDAATAYRYTGGAPTLENAYLVGGDVYGLEFPLDGLAPRAPTAADTTLKHYFGGGHTALRLENKPDPHKDGYLVNTTREFVVPGGGPMPRGSFLFRLGPNGTRVQMRVW
jgi:hypothetical protein